MVVDADEDWRRLWASTDTVASDSSSSSSALSLGVMVRPAPAGGTRWNITAGLEELKLPNLRAFLSVHKRVLFQHLNQSQVQSRSTSEALHEHRTLIKTCVSSALVKSPSSEGAPCSLFEPVNIYLHSLQELHHPSTLYFAGPLFYFFAIMQKPLI